MADESVAIRGFPSEPPNDTTRYSALKKGENRAGKGMAAPAEKSERKFKEKWAKTPMKVTEKGFTIMISLEPNTKFEDDGMNLDNRTPRTFVKFTIGEEAIYSFAISPTTPTYHFYPDATVKTITYTKSSGAIKIEFSNGEVFSVKKGKVKFSAANPDGTNGFVITPGDAVDALPDQFVMIAPITEKAAMKAVLEAGEDLLDEVVKLNKRGVGLYVFNAETATPYITPQSFTGNEKIDSKFLLTPSVDFEDLKELDMKKEFIIFDLICENRTFTTDNYTGYDAKETTAYIVRLVFPGDDAKLAPNGTTAEGTVAQCGLESPKGRVLKSITPAYNDAGNISQVRMEFKDGSTCIFPDAETQGFSATDKENEQLLRGTVQGLAPQKGSYQESYMKEEANRIERNTDEFANIFDEKGKSITSAIAWKEKGVIKILVPDPENKKGSILITILKEA